MSPLMERARSKMAPAMSASLPTNGASPFSSWTAVVSMANEAASRFPSTVARVNASSSSRTMLSTSWTLSGSFSSQKSAAPSPMPADAMSPTFGMKLTAVAETLTMVSAVSEHSAARAGVALSVTAAVAASPRASPVARAMVRRPRVRVSFEGVDVPVFMLSGYPAGRRTVVMAV